ncbi:hypothetical protein GCM10011390_41970 [Aureimonas endophytica]|uniref:Uncharacterized protein n=1 Tax=Aureimonas endophytica TaxID=2027858 RepID=A0A916ZXU0_9HYPH|nr:hypothetical protein GCM10011390_41970 [Aureimonas endophytica]
MFQGMETAAKNRLGIFTDAGCSPLSDASGRCSGTGDEFDYWRARAESCRLAEEWRKRRHLAALLVKTDGVRPSKAGAEDEEARRDKRDKNRP